jgi:hypothetical protein
VTETEFQKQVTDLAEILGWSWVHFRPAQTSKGWRTPVSGPLGKGWVDLVLVKGRRLIFAELKADKGKLTPEQERVLNVLGGAGHETHVWFPVDFDKIVRTLQ